MTKGLVYFARNSAFQHLTKIGKTSKLNVEERGLTASNVPEDFDYLAVLHCDDMDSIECKIHEQFKMFRHYSATGRKTEFFWSGCIDDAIKYARDLKGVSDITETETEEIPVIVNGEQHTARRPNTTFKMIGLEKGCKILLDNDPNKAAIVEDDKNLISYKDQAPQPISNVVNQIKAPGKYNGFLYFYYKGKRLFDMRPDMQQPDELCLFND